MSARQPRRPGRMARAATAPAVALVVAASLAGCGVGQRVVTHRHTVRTTRTVQPTVRVVHRVHTVAAGKPAELLEAQEVDGRRLQVDLVMRAGRPSVSTGPLAAYADGPEHGYFLTVRLSIRNRGQVTVLVRPQQFTVTTAGASPVTSYDGAAPYSGAKQQLDPVPLAPGQSVHKPLTFDVGAAHGTLTYTPEGRPAIRWRF